MDAEGASPVDAQLAECRKALDALLKRFGNGHPVQLAGERLAKLLNESL